MLPYQRVRAGFPFPCFWQDYLNFDTSSSFLRRILELLTACRTLRPVILDSSTGCPARVVLPSLAVGKRLAGEHLCFALIVLASKRDRLLYNSRAR